MINFIKHERKFQQVLCRPLFADLIKRMISGNTEVCAAEKKTALCGLNEIYRRSEVFENKQMSMHDLLAETRNVLERLSQKRTAA